MTASLARIDTPAILRFLRLPRETPSLDYLGRLQDAYHMHVPWETASRIVRASSVARQDARPRRPAEFWRAAMVSGTGGTCFESDFAFWALLHDLGFDAELRINDMPDRDGVRCHAALVVALDGARYLVDVGLGTRLYQPFPLTQELATTIRGPGYEFTLRWLGDDRYEIRSSNPDAPPGTDQLYVLVDRPVSLEEYDARVVEDYGETGLFLDAIRLTRHLPDGGLWRYSSDAGLRRLEDGAWEEYLLTEGDRRAHIATLARIFGVPHQLLDRAFDALRLTL